MVQHSPLGIRRRFPRSLLCATIAMFGMPATGCLPRYGHLDSRLSTRIHDRTRDIKPLELAPRESSIDGASGATGLESGDSEIVDDVLEKVADDFAGDDTGPEPVALSLADLRLKTLRNNLDLEVALQDPGVARTIVSEEEAKFDSLISSGFQYKKQDIPELDDDLVGFTSFNKDLDKQVVKLTQIEQQKEKLTYDLGLTVPLPTGGKVKLSGSMEDSAKLAPREFEQHVSGVKFSLSQPLLRGAGYDANVASIRLARLSAGKVAVKTKLAAIKVLAGAEKSYWKLYGTQKLREIRREQFNLAAQDLNMVKRRVEEGLSAEIEIIRSELGLTQRLEALIIADTEYRLAQRELRRIVNDDSFSLEADVQVEAASEPRLVPLDISRSNLAEAALENRMELMEVELSLAQDAIKIELEKNKALPYLMLSFEYGLLDRRGTFSSAWQHMWDFDNSELSVGLRGELPVTNEARRSRVRRAILERAQRLSTQDMRRLSIRQEVFDAIDALNRDWLRILAARKNVIVAGLNYEAERTQFQEGLRTMREVVEALTSLGDARQKEVKAIVSYQVSQIDLAYATGTLLGYARVGLEPLSLTDPFAFNGDE